MGKSRVKKSRKILKHACKDEKGSEGNLDTSELVPLPESIMKSQAILPLTDAVDQAVTERPAQKKDRRKLRHQQWLQKLEGHRMAREARRSTEQRKKTVIVGDLQQLIAALPTTANQLPKEDGAHDCRRDTIPISYHRQKKTRGDSTGNYSTAQGKCSVLSEVDHFQKVLEHEAFKEDPLSAITQHVTNAVAKHVL